MKLALYCTCGAYWRGTMSQTLANAATASARRARVKAENEAARQPQNRL